MMSERQMDKVLRDLALDSPEFFEGMAKAVYRENVAHVRQLCAEDRRTLPSQQTQKGIGDAQID